MRQFSGEFEKKNELSGSTVRIVGHSVEAEELYCCSLLSSRPRSLYVCRYILLLLLNNTVAWSTSIYFHKRSKWKKWMFMFMFMFRFNYAVNLRQWDFLAAAFSVSNKRGKWGWTRNCFIMVKYGLKWFQEGWERSSGGQGGGWCGGPCNKLIPVSFSEANLLVFKNQRCGKGRVHDFLCPVFFLMISLENVKRFAFFYDPLFPTVG